MWPLLKARSTRFVIATLFAILFFLVHPQISHFDKVELTASRVKLPSWRISYVMVITRPLGKSKKNSSKSNWQETYVEN